MASQMKRTRNSLAGVNLPDLEAALRRLIAAIPAGHVVSCGTLAEVLGDFRAARWIGSWLGDHQHDPGCCCHRVVRAGGRWGPSPLSQEDREKLLLKEGVLLTSSGADPRCLMDAAQLRALCPEVATKSPLLELQALQVRLCREIRLCPLEREPQSVGGVDVSYRGDMGVAAYCRIAWPSGEKLWDTHIALPTRFPYIVGYLAFRELPLLQAVLDKAEQEGQLAEVIMVDGSGLLHPRGMGIASHLGLLLNRPTIGVTKTLLCGKCETEDLSPGQSAPIVYRDQVLGAVLRSRTGHAQPVFVCPGHRIDVASAVKIVSPLFGAHRLPEPIYWADRISLSLARRFIPQNR